MTDNINIDDNLPSFAPPENSNLLSINKFRLVINRFPTTNFFAQSVVIPAVNIGEVRRATNQWVDYKLVGDKVEFEDLIVTFTVDEDLKAYDQILQWIYKAGDTEFDNPFSDISVLALNNNYIKNRIFKFYNCFPSNVGNITFDTTQAEDAPQTVDVIFKYSHFFLE